MLLKHQIGRRTWLIAGLVTAGFVGLAMARKPSSETTSQSRLEVGNARFVKEESIHPNIDTYQRNKTFKDGQHPFATVLGCSDSRVPVEQIFDQGIGDIFVVRVAGNVAGVDEIASVEYGTGHLHTPLLVVLGHTKCGAVRVVVDQAEVTGHLKSLLALIQPAAKRAHQMAPTATENELVRDATRENVWQSIADILKQSESVRNLVAKGELTIVGAIYDLESGKTQWLGSYADQDSIIKSNATATPTVDLNAEILERLGSE